MSSAAVWRCGERRLFHQQEETQSLQRRLHVTIDNDGEAIKRSLDPRYNSLKMAFVKEM